MHFFKMILCALAMVTLAGCVSTGGRIPFSQAQPDQQVIILRVMAMEDFRKGDTPAGIKKLDEAMTIAETAQDIDNLVHVHIDLANEFVKLGRLAEAEGEARAALRKSRASAHHAGEGKALHSLGRLKLKDSPDEAREFYRMAAEAYGKAPNIHSYAVTTRLEYAEFLMHQDLVAAGLWIDEAGAVARRKKDQALEADVLTARAELLGRQGRYDDALAALSDAGRLILPSQKRYFERHAGIETLKVTVLALSDRHALTDDVVRNFSAFWTALAGEESMRARTVLEFAANLHRLGYTSAAAGMGEALSVAAERWRTEDVEKTKREKNVKNVIIKNRYFADAHAFWARLQMKSGRTAAALKSSELALDNVPRPFKPEHIGSDIPIDYTLSPAGTELLRGYSEALAASGDISGALDVLDLTQKTARADLSNGSRLAIRASIALLRADAAGASAVAREILSEAETARAGDWYPIAGIMLDLAESELSRDPELAAALARKVAEIPLYDADLARSVRAYGLLAGVTAGSASETAKGYRQMHAQLSDQLARRQARRPESS
ncbi:hypothetical protein [Nisaea sediminum]|uniref:hypothetical protein n=1 Tax=Nisaea sediminum TaxID=2775867 RepID=UPI001D019F12|nr:hypothetical protein [Nisaea sediminum]